MLDPAPTFQQAVETQPRGQHQYSPSVGDWASLLISSSLQTLPRTAGTPTPISRPSYHIAEYEANSLQNLILLFLQSTCASPPPTKQAGCGRWVGGQPGIAICSSRAHEHCGPPEVAPPQKVGSHLPGAPSPRATTSKLPTPKHTREGRHPQAGTFLGVGEL